MGAAEYRCLPLGPPWRWPDLQGSPKLQPDNVRACDAISEAL